MLETNTAFDAKHDLAYKTPMFLVHFDGEEVYYCNHRIERIMEEWGGGEAWGVGEIWGDGTLKPYLVTLSGNGQKVTPEEGSASIAGFKIELLDYDNEITALLATDTYYFHRRKATIKAGYVGMDEASMLTVFTGWVTDLMMSSDLTSYIFDVTDPQRWMQRNIFRDASDSSPVTVQGNPINILLAVLTSTGEGTNGDYDWLDEANGLGLSTDFINVTAIENVRDRWYPGDSNYLKFTITEKEKAKDWIEKEILKVLNAYPVIDGQGRFSIKPFKPPLPALESVQSFDEDNIIGLPQWNANLDALINEVDIFYNHNATSGNYDSETYYIEGTSLTNRGPGKKALTIKSKGLHGSNIGSHPDRTADIITSRKNKVFGRFATPPEKVSITTFFSRWLSEAGDIVPFTHPMVPDVVTGARGYTAERMEIINRNPDWKRGTVKIELLNTGFARGAYAVISPVMAVTTASDSTSFTVASTDAEKYEEGWAVDVFDSGMRAQATSISLVSIDTTSGLITCDDIGATPAAGWKVQFASASSSLTNSQALYWSLASASTAAQLITP